MPLIRSDLRLALTAGLANAFASLSPLAFGVYMPLAVLAVCTGTFGGSIVLGQQRILGSVIGMGVLILGLKGLSGISFPLAIAFCLGAMRLLGGLLGLEVGYKVGGMIIVMGWLVHDQQLTSWVPLRLFWTAAGIVLGVVSMRVLWPARALPQAWRQQAAVLQALAENLDRVAIQIVEPGDPTPAKETANEEAPLQTLRQQLGALRAALPAVNGELGQAGRQSPQARLLLMLLDTSSTLVSVLEGLQRHAPMAGATGTLVSLQEGEAKLVRTVADRLRLWAPLISQITADSLHPPPQPAWRAPSSWQQLQPLLGDVSLREADLARLQRHASRLLHCGQAERAMLRTEALWTSISSSSPRNLRLPTRQQGVRP
ncbi:MAG: FUSC family protein [Cyanobium sp.]